jgi:hypothetical protein
LSIPIKLLQDIEAPSLTVKHQALFLLFLGARLGHEWSMEAVQADTEKEGLAEMTEE